MAEKCVFVKPNGDRCGSWSMQDSNFCFFHDPEKQKARDQARSRGGKGKSRLSKTLTDAMPQEVEILPAEQSIQINTLDDLQVFAENQMQYIEDAKRFSALSQADRNQMRKWCEFLLKVLMCKGLGWEARIVELEDQLDQLD